jgi:hypothetical protein
MNNQIKLNYYDILNSIRMQYLKSKIPFNIINDNSIKLTYNEIKLKYIDNKNYFIKIDQKSPVTSNVSNVFLKKNEDKNGYKHQDKTDALDRKYEYKIEKLKRHKNKELPKDKQKIFTPEETAAYLKRKSVYEKEKLNKELKNINNQGDSISSLNTNMKPSADIKKKYAYKMEKLKRKENKELPKEDQKKFTAEETAAYLERRANYEKEKLNKAETKNYKKEFTAEETAAYLERRKQYAKEKENKATSDSQIVAGYQKVPLNKIHIFY